jgi:hypothetical protein
LPLQLISGGVATAAANQTLYWTTTFGGEVYEGPIYVSANFVGAENNYGTVTTVQTSVNTFEAFQSCACRHARGLPRLPVAAPPP